MTGKMKREGKVIAFSAFILIMINAFCILLPLEKDRILIAGDIFMCLFFGILIVSSYMSKIMENAKSRFFGWPIFATGVKFFICNIVLNIFLITINQFERSPFWLILLSNIILLCVEGIALIGVESGSEFVIGQDERRKQRTQTMKVLQTQLNILCVKYDSGEIGKQLKKLQEQFRYSDPNSSPASVEAELKLQKTLEDLSVELEKDQKLAIQLIGEIETMLKIRNQLALLK